MLRRWPQPEVSARTSTFTTALRRNPLTSTRSAPTRPSGSARGRFFLSEDNGKTWPHQGEFEDAKNITFSCILKNGNILFATLNKLYLSTDNLKTHREITVKDRDGGDYLPHTSRNPAKPGWYFHSLDAEHTFAVDGEEMLVWGNYGNVLGGAVPLNIYYSTDQGETVKIAYSFGQGRRYTDGGTLLGDPNNPVTCRHIHCVAYNPAEKAFYACTGDHDGGSQGLECHWLRGTYSAKDDRWDWKVVVSESQTSRYKSGGINFRRWPALLRRRRQWRVTAWPQTRPGYLPLRSQGPRRSREAHDVV